MYIQCFKKNHEGQILKYGYINTQYISQVFGTLETSGEYVLIVLSGGSHTDSLHIKQEDFVNLIQSK